MTPAEISAAYGLTGLTAVSGKANGAGQTIAIVEAYGDSRLASDLAVFDAQYGLSAANLTIVNQNGSSTSLPATNASWSLETSLDVEWAHAVAPGANIVVVEANSSSVSDLMKAVQTAANGVTVNGVTYNPSVVSMSWGSSEFAGETQYDSVFSKAGVTFVASSGDDGGASGAEWPAASPDVLSVGGTSLSITQTGTGSSATYAYGSETAWSLSGNRFSGYSGSGGGVSTYESAPAYQSGLGTSGRSTPDVSYDANPSSGVAVYDSLQGGWSEVGGTSAGAPQWAALVAIADQGRAAAGTPLLSSSTSASASSSTQGLLYAASANSTTYASIFHDITSGSNAAGSAKKGYDLVTGLGSPIAGALVSYLISPSTSSTTTTNSVAATTSHSSNTTTTTNGASNGSTNRTIGTFASANSVTNTVSVAAQATSTTDSVVVIPVVLTSQTTSTTTSATTSNTGSSLTTSSAPTSAAVGQSVPGAMHGASLRFFAYDVVGVSRQVPMVRDSIGPMFDANDRFDNSDVEPGELIQEGAIAEGAVVPLDRVVLEEAGAMEAAPLAVFDDADSSIRVTPAWAAGVAAVIGLAWGLRARSEESDGGKGRRRASRFTIEDLLS